MLYNRLMRYNWHQKDWPNFRFDPAAIEAELRVFAEGAGFADGLCSALPEPMPTEAVVNLLILEAMKTSEIEGEFFSREDVMSSVRNRLRLQPPSPKHEDQGANGVAELMVEVRETFAEPLTEAMLFNWHATLMQGRAETEVGRWRTGADPMQVVSGRQDRPTEHFEAPPAERVAAEMERFLTWFNASADEAAVVRPAALVRAAVAHLYFESIHPFEDGNGRIGRAISEKAIAQGLGRPVLLSLSLEIEANRTAYYDALQAAQRGQRENEITPWIQYFATMAVAAQKKANEHIRFVVWQTHFFERFGDQLNKRQLKVLRRMIDAGLDGFVGGMSTKKYVAMTGTSRASATRDLQDLLAKGAVTRSGEGRGVRYWLPSPRISPAVI